MGVYREDEVRLFSGVHSERQEATVAIVGREITYLFKIKKFSIITVVNKATGCPERWWGCP